MRSQPETIDARFDALVAQLRAAPPAAPEHLRARVRAVGSVVPSLPRRRRPFARWIAVPAAALVLAAVIGIAVVRDADRDAAPDYAAGGGTALRAQEATSSRDAVRAAPLRSASDKAGATALPAPAPRRLQDYGVSLGVRVGSVGELSRATARAIRITRSLRGYVVAARDDAATEGGDSFLVVRVPVTRVQDAIAQFSALGDIVSQSVRIDDVQAQVNAQGDRISALRVTIARLAEQLRRTDLSAAERIRLEERRAAAQAELRRLRAARDAAVRRARLARVSLTLTTREPVARDDSSGGFGGTIRDALGVVATLLTWAVAGAIVAAPFVALAAVSWIAARRARRRANDRLLERA